MDRYVTCTSLIIDGLLWTSGIMEFHSWKSQNMYIQFFIQADYGDQMAWYGFHWFINTTPTILCFSLMENLSP